MLPALTLFEAERLETKDDALEAQGPPDIPYPPVGMVSFYYLHRSGQSFRGESDCSERSIPLGQGRSNLGLPHVSTSCHGKKSRTSGLYECVLGRSRRVWSPTRLRAS